jgi:hypothetical protein
VCGTILCRGRNFTKGKAPSTYTINILQGFRVSSQLVAITSAWESYILVLYECSYFDAMLGANPVTVCALNVVLIYCENLNLYHWKIMTVKYFQVLKNIIIQLQMAKKKLLTLRKSMNYSNQHNIEGYTLNQKREVSNQGS